MVRGRSINRSQPSARSSAALLVEARASLIAAGCAFALVAALCVTLLLFLAPAAVDAVPSAPSSTDLQGEAKAQVDDLTTQAVGIQAEIEALDTELEGQTESFNQLQVRLTEVNQQLTALRRELKAAESDHAYRVKKCEARLCSLYKSGGDDEEFLALLLESEGLGDFIQRVRLIATLADLDRRVVDNLEESTDRLNSLLAQIDTIKTEELALREEIENQRQQIETALADRESALSGIDGQIASIIAQEEQRRRAETDGLRSAVLAMLNGWQVYSGGVPQTDDELINQFLETAAYYIGIPYVWAGDRPSTGFDCSGYTAYVYAQHGVSLPHYSGFQAEMGTPVMPEDIQPGDLLAFGLPVHHVGIYIGDGLFIHAPRTGDVVSIWELSWKTNLSYIRRFDIQPRYGEPAVW